MKKIIYDFLAILWLLNAVYCSSSKGSSETKSIEQGDLSAIESKIESENTSPKERLL